MGVMPSSSAANISQQIEAGVATGMIVITNKGITSVPEKSKTPYSRSVAFKSDTRLCIE